MSSSQWNVIEWPCTVSNSILLSTVWVQMTTGKTIKFYAQGHLCRDWHLLFSGGSVVKNSPASAGDSEDLGSMRCPRVGNGNPCQYSCLKTSMDRLGLTLTLTLTLGLQRVRHDWACMPSPVTTAQGITYSFSRSGNQDVEVRSPSLSPLQGERRCNYSTRRGVEPSLWRKWLR